MRRFDILFMVMYYLLFYDVTPDYLERRTQFREAHLKLAQEAHQKGLLIYGGALADPVDEAVLLFHADDSTAVEDFAKSDPYVTNGLVTRWRVRKWTVVIGSE